jgi:hypothetical protein
MASAEVLFILLYLVSALCCFLVDETDVLLDLAYLAFLLLKVTLQTFHLSVGVPLILVFNLI